MKTYQSITMLLILLIAVHATNVFAKVKHMHNDDQQDLRTLVNRLTYQVINNTNTAIEYKLCCLNQKNYIDTIWGKLGLANQEMAHVKHMLGELTASTNESNVDIGKVNAENRKQNVKVKLHDMVNSQLYMRLKKLEASMKEKDNNIIAMEKKLEKLERRSCPKNFKYYQGSCYYASTLKMSWTDAQQKCQSLDKEAHLVSIETAEENAYLISVIDVLGDGAFWTGGTDSVKEGEWRWSTTGKLFTFTKWKPGEPGAGHEDYMCFIKHDILNKWEWHDCSAPGGFICEVSF